MKLIDLFSGCGGFSCGMKMAGYQTVFANEFDGWAAETYSHNNPETPMHIGDIRQLTDLADIKTRIGGVVDGIIGGPPCQGFSLSGNRDKKDPRNSLFMEYARFVGFFKPKFFIMENVPGLRSMKTEHGEKVYDIIVDTFAGLGYNVTSSTLNAAWFGVPQLRERLFIIGIRSDFSFNKQLLFPSAKLEKSKFISAIDAISDLPQINSGQGVEVADYPIPPKNDYQEWIRSGSDRVFNHVAMRHTNRLIERFKIISHGQSVKDVPHEHSALKRGDPSVKSGKVFSQNNMRIYPDRPAPTVAASFQSNFIHPTLHRNITAREGARLQSFPDVYLFMGKRTTMSWEKNLSQYQQIGNAVPPLLARAIGENLLNYFMRIEEIKDCKPVRLRQKTLFEEMA